MKKNISLHLKQGKEVICLFQDYHSVMGTPLIRSSIMIHNLILTNNEKKSSEILKVEIIFKTNKEEIQKSFFNSNILDELVSQGAKAIKTPPLLIQAEEDPFFQKKIVPKRELLPSESLFISKIYLECHHPSKPKNIEIRIYTKSSIYSETFSLLDYKQKNSFSSPMKGALAILGDPWDLWGHRFLDGAEFGIDFITLNKEQKERSKTNSKNEDHYCFQKDIFSCADGKVVQIADGLPDNPKPFHPDLTMKHISQWRSKLPSLQLGGGNFVLIDHGNQEFILYCHLNCNSIIVETGQTIKKGNKIAQCGNSGAGSLTPHLHLQMMNSSSRYNCLSLPIVFEDLDNTIFTQEILKSLNMENDIKDLLQSAKILLVNNNSKS
ncbi:MAG: hypothetical protein COB02_02905 [Candidatus Cloacimonadota bacterium]|nr:MAG: hypothetical protein COB02_02905 [Candidatus Cloacimonadota bacterium]